MAELREQLPVMASGDGRKRGSGAEDEVDRQHETEESGNVVPLERFVFAEEQHEGGEDDKCDRLLYHFQLPQRERSAVLDAAQTVGRNLKAVFEQGDAPAQQYDGCEREALEFRFEDDVTVPRQRHEGVGADEQQDGEDSARHGYAFFCAVQK